VRPGRPAINFLDTRILALLNEKSFHSADPIAGALQVSDSVMLNHLRESLDMKIFLFVLDPARINDQFAADSDGNLSRVIAHSQGSREK
jgi:hypothetical protein